MNDQTTFGYEEDFQKAIVSASLQDPVLLLQYKDVLQSSYFDYDYLSTIMRTARELSERMDEVPTKVTIVEELKEFCLNFNLSAGDREFILGKVDELYSIPITNVDYIRDKVVDFGQRQALRSAILKIVTMFKQPPKEGVDVHEKARDLLESALNTGFDTRSLGLSLYPNLTKLPELVSQSVAGLRKKVPSGFPLLDLHTHGGPGRGELWVVVGLPGKGKSSLLVNLGANALKAGYPVFHFTIGDLEELDVAIRYAARLTLCKIEDVVRGTDEYRQKATMMARYNPHLHIKYFAPDTATMGHIRSHIARLKMIEEVSPAVVIIDYPEELKMPVKNDLYLSGGKNYSMMKQMASEFDALFYAASQPQRWKPEHEKDVIKGVNMGESWKKFQKVDGMFSWNMGGPDNRGDIWVDKTRRGKSFYRIPCDVDLSKMFIKQGLPDEEEEDDDE